MLGLSTFYHGLTSFCVLGGELSEDTCLGEELKVVEVWLSNVLLRLMSSCFLNDDPIFFSSFLFLPVTFQSFFKFWLRASLIPGLLPAWLLCPTPAPPALQSITWVRALCLQVCLFTPALYDPTRKGFLGQINLEVIIVHWNPRGTR